jgi:hypothetical protein
MLREESVVLVVRWVSVEALAPACISLLIQVSRDTHCPILLGEKQPTLTLDIRARAPGAAVAALIRAILVSCSTSREGGLADEAPTITTSVEATREQAASAALEPRRSGVVVPQPLSTLFRR